MKYNVFKPPILTHAPSYESRRPGLECRILTSLRNQGRIWDEGRVKLWIQFLASPSSSFPARLLPTPPRRCMYRHGDDWAHLFKTLLHPSPRVLQIAALGHLDWMCTYSYEEACAGHRRMHVTTKVSGSWRCLEKGHDCVGTFHWLQDSPPLVLAYGQRKVWTASCKEWAKGRCPFCP